MNAIAPISGGAYTSQHNGAAELVFRIIRVYKLSLYDEPSQLELPEQGLDAPDLMLATVQTSTSIYFSPFGNQLSNNIPGTLILKPGKRLLATQLDREALLLANMQPVQSGAGVAFGMSGTQASGLDQMRGEAPAVLFGSYATPLLEAPRLKARSLEGPGVLIVARGKAEVVARF